ncbi:hypothetical protein [Fibrella arboris]|uniref:hypothetical protein n=1 Tax=Fibrella arboris TaxID=3242486 RepID=UPI0035222746
MTSQRLLRLFLCLLISQWLLAPSVWAQNQPLTTKDINEIKRLAQKCVEKDLPERINTLLFDTNTEFDKNEIILNMYTLNEQGQQLFVNDNCTIEDDIDPNHIDHKSAADLDKTLKRYLNDLLQYVSKTSEANPVVFVVSSIRKTEPIMDSPTSAHINIFYESIFRGQSTNQRTQGRSFQRVKRVATLQATRDGKKWTVLISQITFERPGAGVSQTANTVTAQLPTVAETPPPPPIEIREPLKVYRQEDYEFNVTIRRNSKALDVVKTESPRVPPGQYRNDGSGTYELDGNSIRFDEANRNKFIYKNRDRDQLGFVLLQPKAPKPDTTRPLATKPLPDVVTPGYLAPNEEQRKRKAEPPTSAPATETVAVTVPKTAPSVAVNQSAPPPPQRTEPVKPAPKPVTEPPKPVPEEVAPKTVQPTDKRPVEISKPPVTETPKPAPAKPAPEQQKPTAEPAKPVAEPPKTVIDPPKVMAEKAKPVAPPVVPPVDKPTPKPTTPAPVLADVPRAVEKEKLPKPIIQKPAAMSVSPELKKSLTSEQQRMVAGMRLRGWMQVVGGLAALGGSYVAYSGIRKEYDAYSQKVNALNAEYNLYRDLSRRDIPPPPNALSITQYGSPTIYGVYGGGVVGMGLTVNGIRTLLKAGKISKKK